MNPDINQLHDQIQRLHLSKAERERLQEELKTASEKKKQLLAQLIAEHDEEVIGILNEKAVQVQEAKGRLLAVSPIPQPDNVVEAEEKATGILLEQAFSDAANLARFVEATDDLFLAQLEEAIVEALNGQTEKQGNVRSFFKEVRLSKAAVDQETERRYREALAERLQEKQALGEELGELLEKAEILLQQQ